MSLNIKSCFGGAATCSSESGVVEPVRMGDVTSSFAGDIVGEAMKEIYVVASSKSTDGA